MFSVQMTDMILQKPTEVSRGLEVSPANGSSMRSITQTALHPGPPRPGAAGVGSPPRPSPPRVRDLQRRLSLFKDYSCRADPAPGTPRTLTKRHTCGTSKRFSKSWVDDRQTDKHTDRQADRANTPPFKRLCRSGVYTRLHGPEPRPYSCSFSGRVKCFVRQ